MIWNISEALVFLKDLHNYVQPFGWCVGAAGSVLYKGWSDKDLDAILFRMGAVESVTPFRLKEELAFFDMKCIKNEAETKAMWLKDFNSRDTKHVEIWDYKGKRVDLFFLS